MYKRQAPYIGFTENEVKGLCEKYNRDFDKVKKWYDGYLPVSYTHLDVYKRQGVTEAYYSHVPLIAITFDRSPYVLNQLETQKIDQMTVFDSITKANIELPMIKDEEDTWYCERILNEAFISIRQHDVGPIHINIPLVGSTNDLWKKQESISESIKFIEYYSYETDNWELLKNCLLYTSPLYSEI